jgi:hypothetical protein
MKKTTKKQRKHRTQKKKTPQRMCQSEIEDILPTSTLSTHKKTAQMV